MNYTDRINDAILARTRRDLDRADRRWHVAVAIGVSLVLAALIGLALLLVLL